LNYDLKARHGKLLVLMPEQLANINDLMKVSKNMTALKTKSLMIIYNSEYV